MSRIRIVGGTITKTTVGDHNIYSEGNIVYNSGKSITETSDEGITYGEPKDPPKREASDFDITFELDKNEKSVVPFGILDFEDKIENPFFSFKYKLTKSKIDSLSFQILDENDTPIYQMTHLKTVIVQVSKKPEILFEAKKPTEGPLISKTWDFLKIYNKYSLVEPDDYTKEGEYFIHWDGFDDNEIYDSTRFNGKKLKAKITATNGDKQKSLTVDFSTKYSEADWTDIKIDKNAKRIDVTLRVDMTDGSAEGLSCWPNTRDYNPPSTKTEICDWDKIPVSDINPGQPIIKSRTQSFSDLEKLAIEGLNYHWGRNKNHLEGKNVKINSDLFEVFIDTINTKKNAMVSIDLIYNTNNSWGRSGNPGVLARIYYNEGYVKYSNGWGYINGPHAELEYKHTSGHEIGHSILKAYGGMTYSWQHKGSSYLLPQDVKPVKGNETFSDHFKKDNMKEISGEYYPKSGEIDLMKYYNYENDKTGRRIPVSKIEERSVATEKDIMILIWLTKLKIS
ncbi:hypothetical protein IRZ71_10805 [Flavobacterium sp. ANB]|uniref:hypothetical protein n=1 Tax=unclassified Flavobacterium TaxID=196869 RepID=UPI0012B75057|nr:MULTISPECIES: hypothetical protein [unclassified Flavobacterium]MBF4516839.1 hypothetical protein [Flavobacterium sp. ANB]MTD69265.1 hypothetical protein [Flavobacterium sp. LC2016-13]